MRQAAKNSAFNVVLKERSFKGCGRIAFRAAAPKGASDFKELRDR
jgi:hypothetical protein